MAIASFGFSQDVKKETLKVAGECGMCKKKIEKAAKDAGAAYADWNTQTKILTISYNSLSTNSAKIQQKIAGVGYDTPQFKATDEAYNKLEKCCQYDRTEATTGNSSDKTKSCCQKTADGKMPACCDDSSKNCCEKKTEQQ